jgi:ElaB/YqjD/DUF883 family membrane-anchored ribosome-binding protein
MNRHNGHTRDPREIEAELDRTRMQMGNTLEALQRKLSPGELFDQAMGYVRGSGGSEFTSNLKQSVAQNPVPVGLVGLGLAWLMLSGRGSSQADTLHAGDGGHRIGEAASGARDRITGATSSAHEKSRAAAERARAGLGHLASSSRERMQHLSHSARSGAERAKSGLDYMLNEQPLVLGAVGMALGALVAASLPRTRREDELMGRARDEFVERAREQGQAQAEKARRVAESAGDAAKEAARDEAHKQGLSSAGRQESTSGYARHSEET